MRTETTRPGGWVCICICDGGLRGLKPGLERGRHPGTWLQRPVHVNAGDGVELLTPTAAGEGGRPGTGILSVLQMRKRGAGR